MRNQEEELNDSWRILRSTGTKFHPKFLRKFGENILDSAERTIQKGRLKRWHAPLWRDGMVAISLVFGLERSPHFFRSKPIVWTKFTEPQITKGFAYFLTDGDTARNLLRTDSLLRSLGVPLPNDVQYLAVEAEHQTNNRKKIDLLIQWENANKEKHGVVIEAKFGHVITPGQLAGYRTYIRTKLGIPRERASFFVVAPGFDNKNKKVLKRNRDWRIVMWHALLIDYQRALPVEADCEEFRRFRRTVWHRV